MDAIEQLKEDLRLGRISVDRLVDLLVSTQHKLQAAQQLIDEQAKRLDEQAKRIAELEKQLSGTGGSGGTAGSAGSDAQKVDQPYSVAAEEKRQEARGKKKRKRKSKKRRGRVTTAEKIKQAKRREPAYPEGVDKSKCKLSHTRVVWRLENGQGVLIAYDIYRGPKNQYGKIPGVLGRSEFGLEIVVEIAHLVHVVGLSFDKVCGVLHFFQNLSLSKSQVDALLYRLSRHWENEFDVLCTLLANSLVVHTDETSWSINSVWAFLSEKARVLLFGVHKDADTLSKILDPASFAGIVISDDAAVYANFTQSQKCWAHLLRKAIKLTLQDPDNEEYRAFTDLLLEIYRGACRVQRDRRLGDAGRERKVAELEGDIRDACEGMWLADPPPLEGPEDDYRLLVNELMRLMLDGQLFTFVTAKPVEQLNGESQPVAGTNNESERTLRDPGQARATGRTSKTPKGCRRKTVLTSVFESLRLYLATYTLSEVMKEVHRWLEKGRSCFADLLDKLKLTRSKQPLLDQVLPLPNS